MTFKEIKNPKILILVLICFIFLPSIIYAPDGAWISSNNSESVPLIYERQIDSETLNKLSSINDNFTSGETISSATMNKKFNEIKELLEKILKYNTLNVSMDNPSSAILFATNTKYFGNIGTVGLNDACQNDVNASIVSEKNSCDTFKAVLNDSLISDYHNHNFYSYRGILIGTNWQQTKTNLDPSTHLGLYSGSFWFDDTGNENCNSWSDLNQYAGTANPVGSNINWSYTSYSCSGDRYLLCMCDVNLP